MIKLVNNRIGGICTWVVEGADAEVAAGEYVAKRCVTDIVVEPRERQARLRDRGRDFWPVCYCPFRGNRGRPEQPQREHRDRFTNHTTRGQSFTNLCPLRASRHWQKRTADRVSVNDCGSINPSRDITLGAATLPLYNLFVETAGYRTISTAKIVTANTTPASCAVRAITTTLLWLSSKRSPTCCVVV